VATIAHRVAVMYGGQIVEIGPTSTLFSKPQHPYTEGLLSSIPRHDRDSLVLRAIAGSVPPLDQMPAGCRFAPRCSLTTERCLREVPRLAPVALGSAHSARCWVRAP
jgi:peptide/nickel transport system ATP-binding protein